MAVFKIVEWNKEINGLDKYDSELISKLIHYILRADKNVRYWGVNHLLLSNVETMIDQFYIVQEVYHKYNIIQARHFVLSFHDEYDAITPNQANRIGELICQDLFPEYQTIYAVHEKGSKKYGDYNVHVHFVINTVNINTGKQYPHSKIVFQELLYHVAQLLRMPYLWGGSRSIKLLSGMSY